MRDKHNAGFVVVENNAYQQALIDWMKTIGSNVNIIPFTTGKQKADEFLGLPGLAAEFANGLWEIPFSEEHGPVGLGCTCGKCMLIAELEEHPFGDCDTVMAIWFARFAAQSFGFPVEPDYTTGIEIGRSGKKRDRSDSMLSRFRGDRRGRQ